MDTTTSPSMQPDGASFVLASPPSSKNPLSGSTSSHTSNDPLLIAPPPSILKKSSQGIPKDSLVSTPTPPTLVPPSNAPPSNAPPSTVSPSSTPSTSPSQEPEEFHQLDIHDSDKHVDFHDDHTHIEDNHLTPVDERVSHKHLRAFVFDCLPFQRSEKLYVPHVWPNIPSNEAVIMWDKFKHNYLQPMLADQAKYSPAGTAPTPPLRMRILALILMCLMIWGGGMCYASVGAMTSLIEKEYDISVSQLGTLYSIYSLPTMFSVFFAGYLADRIGINICALSYTGLVLLGSFIAASGNSYIAMMIGRFLYGLGNESAGVVQSALVGRWYAHDSKMSLSLTMAITLSFYRASSFVSMSVLPSIASVGLHFCLWVLFIAAGLSFMATIGLVYIDRKYKDYLHVAETGEPISIKDIRKFSAEFWVMAFVTFFFYAAILTFFTISNDFLQDKWGYSLSAAGLISSVIYLTPAICVPFLGYLTDHVGQRCKLMLLSSALIVPAYLILAYTHIPAIVGTLLLGFAYSILPVCLWAGVALIMPTNILGTAYGVLTSLLNTGSFLCPLIVTSIQGSTDSYTKPILFLLSLGCAAFVLCLGVFYLDKYKSNSVLERTSVLKARDKKE